MTKPRARLTNAEEAQRHGRIAKLMRLYPNHAEWFVIDLETLEVSIRAEVFARRECRGIPHGGERHLDDNGDGQRLADHPDRLHTI
jgi:hypothetical protein